MSDTAGRVGAKRTAGRAGAKRPAGRVGAKRRIETPLRAAMARANERIRRALGMSRPLPRVAADLRIPAPAWSLRALQLLLVVGCVAVSDPTGLGWFVGVVLGGLMVILPRPFWPALFAAWCGFVVLVGSQDPFPPSAFALLFGVHLLLALSAVLDRIPFTARVELPVLAAPARRFVVVQAFSQALALLAAWVTAAEVSVVWVAVTAGALVAVVMWVIVARLTRVAGDDEDEWD